MTTNPNKNKTVSVDADIAFAGMSARVGQIAWHISNYSSLRGRNAVGDDDLRPQLRRYVDELSDLLDLAESLGGGNDDH